MYFFARHCLRFRISWTSGLHFASSTMLNIVWHRNENNCPSTANHASFQVPNLKKIQTMLKASWHQTEPCTRATSATRQQLDHTNIFQFFFRSAPALTTYPSTLLSLRSPLQDELLPACWKKLSRLWRKSHENCHYAAMPAAKCFWQTLSSLFMLLRNSKILKFNYTQQTFKRTWTCDPVVADQAHWPPRHRAPEARIRAFPDI